DRRVQVEMSGDEPRRARSAAVLLDRAAGGGAQRRMRGEAEVVVGGEEEVATTVDQHLGSGARLEGEEPAAERGGVEPLGPLGELDRVLGGGLVQGSVVLVGGDPGIGKSTLALQACGALARQGLPVLYVAGEESPEQVRLRAERLGMAEAGVGDVHVLPETAT